MKWGRGEGGKKCIRLAEAILENEQEKYITAKGGKAQPLGMPRRAIINTAWAPVTNTNKPAPCEYDGPRRGKTKNTERRICK